MAHRVFLARTVEEVADALSVPRSRFRYLLSLEPAHAYRCFSIPKRRGGMREIYAPCAPLKEAQRSLADALSEVWQPAPISFGFLPGRSIVDNARAHVGKQFILNLDLQDFFPSITRSQIEEALKEPPFLMLPEVAHVVACLACYGEVLAQGSPSSPILSDVVARPLDEALMGIAQKAGCSYSRYADDMTFSADDEAVMRQIAWHEKSAIVLDPALETTIQDAGFAINTRKTTLTPFHAHQEVTGVVVNQKLNVRRHAVRQLKSILFNCAEKGVYSQALRYLKLNRHQIPSNVRRGARDRAYLEAWFSQVLKGKVEFVRMVKGSESPTFHMLATRYNQVFGPVFIVPAKGAEHKSG